MFSHLLGVYNKLEIIWDKNYKLIHLNNYLKIKNKFFFYENEKYDCYLIRVKSLCIDEKTIK